MRSLLWLFVLLVCVPTLLYEAGVALLILVYLFVLNVVSGQRFWMRRRLGGLGRNAVALAYVASGVFFFAFLVEPMKIDSVPVGHLGSLAALHDVPGAGRRLAGTPLEQTSVDRRSGIAVRPWLQGLVEDVVRHPEETR